MDPFRSKSNIVARGRLTSFWEWSKSRGRTTKPKIAQNLCVRFTPEQFSYLPWVMRHQEMHSLVRFYSLGEFPTEGQVSGMTRCREKYSIFSTFFELQRIVQGFRDSLASSRFSGRVRSASDVWLPRVSVRGKEPNAEGALRVIPRGNPG